MDHLETKSTLSPTKFQLPISSQSPTMVAAPHIGFSPHSMRYYSLADQHRIPSATPFHYPTPQSQPRQIYFDVGVRFGARLRELRRSANMTQIDMAVAFGIDRSYISDVECGKKGISLATLEVVAMGFHTTLSDLLCGI